MKYKPTHNEAITKIQNKFSILTDLFDFYQTIEDHDIGALFRTKSYNGIVGIVDDCIDKLEDLKTANDTPISQC